MENTQSFKESVNSAETFAKELKTKSLGWKVLEVTPIDPKDMPEMRSFGGPIFSVKVWSKTFQGEVLVANYATPHKLISIALVPFRREGRPVITKVMGGSDRYCLIEETGIFEAISELVKNKQTVLERLAPVQLVCPPHTYYYSKVPLYGKKPLKIVTAIQRFNLVSTLEQLLQVVREALEPTKQIYK